MLKVYKPVTPASRSLKRITYSNFFFYKQKIKNQCQKLTRKYGRNSQGKITSYHKGGGCSRTSRCMYTFYFKSAIVLGLEYDPDKTAFLMRLLTLDTKKLIYKIAPSIIKRGDLIRCQFLKFDYRIGHFAPLLKLPYGAQICNIPISPSSKKAFACAAGTYAQIIQKNPKYCLLKLSSGELRYILSNTLAMFGRISNQEHKFTIIGKAGRQRWLNRRPIVRGVAMNPIDHPHGGGQGKTSAGRPSVSPWGKLTKGVKTSTNKLRNSLVVTRRTKNG